MNKLFFLLFLAIAAQISAATRTAFTTSLNDVTNAILGTGTMSGGTNYTTPAADGDVISIPAGTSNWAGTVNYSAALTLQGAGIGSTILKNDAPGTGNTNSGVFNVTTAAGKDYRITGIEFHDGDTRLTTFSKGIVSLRGSSKLVRIDHCKWVTNLNRGLTIYDSVCGVCDHSDFYAKNSSHLFHSTWGSSTLADGSWSSVNSMGTADAWFMEDDTFQPVSGITQVETVDSEGGGRLVLRHCTITNAHLGTHGSEGGADRGMRQFEVYNNTFSAATSYANAIHIRGGSGVFFNNTCTGLWNNFVTLNYYRSAQTFTTWGLADGRNALDSNRASGPFDSGTYTGSNGAITLPITTTTTNHWFGYEIRNVTKGRAAPIMSNTTTTITEWAAASQDGLMTFDNGDTWQIWGLVAGLDMPGMGKDDGLNRTTMVWPNQTIEGVYSWDNTLNGVDATMVAPKFGFIVEGVHMFNDTTRPGYVPFTYPHPLTGNAVGVILILGGSLDFGNVIIGSTPPTSTLTVQNVGSALLTVNSVTYPVGFSGATGGFTVAAGASHDVVVTFTPVAETTYSGNVTFDSDADSGSEIVAASGTGVSSGVTYLQKFGKTLLGRIAK